MRKTVQRLAAISLLAVVSGAASAENLIERTELNRADLSNVPQMEVVVARLVIMPGGTVPLHRHPGDEHAIVIQGGTARTLDGEDIAFSDSVALSFPRGMVHGGFTVTGDKPMIVTTVHVVDKGKPLVEPVQ